jgi:hypothetical protein
MADDLHVFWIRPMPGVADAQRIVIATDNTRQTSVTILLPDNSQIMITADRIVYIKDDRLITLSQWRSVPVPAEYEISEDPPDLPDSRAGTFTLGGRRTYGD